MLDYNSTTFVLKKTKWVPLPADDRPRYCQGLGCSCRLNRYNLGRFCGPCRASLRARREAEVTA